MKTFNTCVILGMSLLLPLAANDIARYDLGQSEGRGFESHRVHHWGLVAQRESGRLSHGRPGFLLLWSQMAKG